MADGITREEKEVSVGQLYKLTRTQNDESESKEPGIYYVGTGTLNVYGSEQLPSDYLTDMKKGNIVNPITGYEPFVIIPNYIYIEEHTATIDNVYLIGVSPIPVSFAP